MDVDKSLTEWICSREAENLTSSKPRYRTLDLEKAIAKKQVRQKFCTQLVVEI